MEGDLIRIPKPWDDDLKNLTVRADQPVSGEGGEVSLHSCKDTGISSCFIRRPETPTWKKPEATAQNSSGQTQ